MKKYKVKCNGSNKGKMSHEFNISTKKKKNKTIHKLYHSFHKNWNKHIQGQLILKVIDTGNNYKIKYCVDFNKLEYDEAEYLYIILKHVIIFDNMFKVKHKIKEINR